MTSLNNRETQTSIQRQFETSEKGLSNQEVARRLSIYGPNEPQPPKNAGYFRQILSLFESPLVVILLLASLISGITRQWIDSILIISMVLISVALNFLQTYHSARAVERLRKDVALTTTVMREGKWEECARANLVPGDVIRITAGDLVPADAVILQSKDLHSQQAALTGESMPVEKYAPESADEILNDFNKLFMGTSVVSGNAIAVVIKTGRNTLFGDVVVRLAAQRPETEFQRGLRQFGYLIARTVFFLVLFVFLVSSLLRHDPLQSLLFAIALAVGLTPEFLPMINTVTLAQGAVQMSKQKVIVKRLEAIQNFGSIDILCSDKTGTITTGEMVLDQHLDPFGQPSAVVFDYAVITCSYETGITNPLSKAILKKRLHPPACVKIDEMPFDFSRRRSSVVVQINDQRILITKGAPESILSASVFYEVDSLHKPMSDETRASIMNLFHNLSEEGFRVLGIAYRPYSIIRLIEHRMSNN